MSIQSRLDRLERATGADDKPTIIVVRWSDDSTPLEDLPCTTHQHGTTTVYRYGVSTIPEHLRGGPQHTINVVYGNA